MYSCHKNSYLQGNFHHIKAGLLNRSVQKAFDGIKIIDEHDLTPPFNRLTSEQPSLPVKNVDVTRRPQAFGRLAIPKLRRELHHKDLLIILAALTILCDIVHDPERAYEAINLKIVNRTVSLLVHESPEIRERTVNLLRILAGYAGGKQAIVDNQDVLDNLLDTVDDEYEEVRRQTAACLEMIAKFWKTADHLVVAGTIQILLSQLNDHKEIVKIHLETLKSLLYCDGKEIAFEEETFQLMMVRLLEELDPTIVAKCCEILTIMCHIKKGRLLATKLNLLPVLYRLLLFEDQQVHTAAAEALMYCTIDSSEKIRATTFKVMPQRLVQLCRNKLNSRTQIFAIKALTSLCEHPIVRKEVNTKFYHDIECIQMSNDVPELKAYKSILMSMLQWMPDTKESLNI